MPDYTNTRIQIRRGTGDSFSSANPILASGEPAFAVDTNVLKIGDGDRAWSALPTINSTVEQKSGGTQTLGDGVSTSDVAFLPTANLDIIKVSSLNSHFTIHGVDDDYAIKQFVLINDVTSGDKNITIKSQSTTAVAANRIYCIPRSDILLKYGQAASFTYDATLNKWLAYKVTANNILALSSTEYADLTEKDPNTIYVVT
tara:strand:- start:2650 stop:3252 length:603 start_codon:yes stop_codon:yes gene_type:complete